MTATEPPLRFAAGAAARALLRDQDGLRRRGYDVVPLAGAGLVHRSHPRLELDGHDTLKAVFRPVHAELGAPARSYATKILSNDASAPVRMVVTPELFGGDCASLP